MHPFIDYDDCDFSSSESDTWSATEASDECNDDESTSENAEAEHDNEDHMVRYISSNMATLLKRANSSEGNLLQLAKDESNALNKMIHRSSIGGVTTGLVYAVQTESSTNPKKAQGSNDESPTDTLRSFLESRGMPYKLNPYDSVPNLFVKGDRSGYNKEVMAAVRQGDLDVLREAYHAGVNLQCCNSFGESIVHAAARRGQADILRFLVDEAEVSVLVCCDTGRNPLHDACWTATPDFEVVQILLSHCPDFLYLSDKRGFTPLQYVPRDSWAEWCDFLQRCDLELLGPRIIGMLTTTPFHHFV